MVAQCHQQCKAPLVLHVLKCKYFVKSLVIIVILTSQMCAVVMGVCDISAKVQITEQYDQVCAESTSIENQNN